MEHGAPELATHLRQWIQDYSNLTAVPAEDNRCHARTVVMNILRSCRDDGERVSFILAFLDKTLHVPSLDAYADGEIDMVKHLKQLAGILARKSAVDCLAGIEKERCVEYLIALVLVNGSGSLEAGEALERFTGAKPPPLAIAGDRASQFWRQWWTDNRSAERFRAFRWRAQSRRLSRAFSLAFPTAQETAVPDIRDKDPIENYALARSPLTPEHVLVVLATNGEPGIRLALAHREDIPPAVLRVIRNDENVIIRQWVARNPAIDSETLTHLLKDPDESVSVTGQVKTGQRWAG